MTEPSPKKKTPVFAWVSAISLGGALTFVTFATGATTFDDLMVKLGLRMTPNTEYHHMFSFGDVTISSIGFTVQNMGANGIPANGIRLAELSGVKYVTYDTENIKDAHGSPIEDGYFVTFHEIVYPFNQPITYDFCNVTARYKLGIPIYHYTTGRAHNNGNRFAVTNEMRQTVEFRNASEFASDIDGANLVNVVMHGDTANQFTSDGITRNWNYCADVHFKGRIEGATVISGT